MQEQSAHAAKTEDAATTRFDAIVIGAGISGLYQLYSLLRLGLSVRAFEEGGGVGGTWYWNRYPGCRFDSESYTYGYSFSQELLQEWNWSELFTAQPENERYLNYVADKFNLREHIQLNARVASAVWLESETCWEVSLESGARARATFLITAVGILSAPFIPDLPGLSDFAGECFNTARWPREEPVLTGKRVAVIGTGSSGVQIIPEIAGEVRHLTVFQRTPNYCVPLNNAPLDAAAMADIKTRYPEIFRLTKKTVAGFIHDFDPRSTFDVSDEERQAKYEELWATPGFGTWLGNFHDVISDKAANELFAEFVRNKIRGRVKDPVVAEKLVPKHYVFGGKRVPAETNYYETYNRDNVTLVDLTESPIETVTPHGIRTRDREHVIDVIIFATGFDAVTGSLTRMDIRGKDGIALREKWSEGPRTYLGLAIAGFPNLFTVLGPHNGATFCNIPRCVEQNVEWVTACLKYLRDRGVTRIEATPAAEDAWTQHSYDTAVDSFFNSRNVSTWWNGGNIPGKKVANQMYLGGRLAYVEKCDEVAAKGYEGFDLR